MVRWITYNSTTYTPEQINNQLIYLYIAFRINITDKAPEVDCFLDKVINLLLFTTVCGNPCGNKLIHKVLMTDNK